MWTVIGMHEDSGATFTCVVPVATSAYNAIRRAVRAFDASKLSDLVILGAVPGAHNLIAACEESGNAAAAVDLRED